MVTQSISDMVQHSIESADFIALNRETIAKMRPGVILINTARGSLIDSEALIEGIDHSASSKSR